MCVGPARRQREDTGSDADWRLPCALCDEWIEAGDIFGLLVQDVNAKMMGFAHADCMDS